MVEELIWNEVSSFKKMYLKDRKINEDGDKRILHNKSKAYAKVIGSFNFFE